MHHWHGFAVWEVTPSETTFCLVKDVQSHIRPADSGQRLVLILDAQPCTVQQLHFKAKRRQWATPQESVLNQLFNGTSKILQSVTKDHHSWVPAPRGRQSHYKWILFIWSLFSHLLMNVCISFHRLETWEITYFPFSADVLWQFFVIFCNKSLIIYTSILHSNLHQNMVAS